MIGSRYMFELNLMIQKTRRKMTMKLRSLGNEQLLRVIV